MENENLTILTKGTLQITCFMPVPVLPFCVGDDDSISRKIIYKICRYVGSCCRVIGSCFDFDDALSKLHFWRDWYKSDEIFMVEVSIVVSKSSL